MLWSKIDLRYIDNYAILLKGDAIKLEEIPEKYQQVVTEKNQKGE